MVKKYYSLTKPGIIYGNLIVAAAGFLLASKNHVNFYLFLATMTGIGLVIGSGCVFNNLLDRNLDKLMERTKNRVLVKNLIPVSNVIVYGIFLGLAGFGTLYIFTNLLTVVLGLVGFLFYVVFYSFYKRRSTLGTLVGSVSGAIPPVAGYCAASNRFDQAALILFLILTFWQMPHFYAIAIYRLKDYAAAKIPVLPVKNGLEATKKQMLFYLIGFLLSCAALTFFRFTGYTFLVVSLALGSYWLYLDLKGFKTKDNPLWARRMFLFSLVIIITLSVMIPAGALLP